MTTATITLNRQTGKYEAHVGNTVFMRSGNKNYIKWHIATGRNSTAKRLGVTNVVDKSDIARYTNELRSAIISGENTSVVSVNNDQESTVDVIDSMPEISFGINERFSFVADFVEMVGKRKNASAIIVGSGGLGKSHTTLETLVEKCGLREVDTTVVLSEDSDDMDDGDIELDEKASREAVKELLDEQAGTFLVVRGYTTAKGLYRILYENRNRVIIFDDCDDIFTNTTSMELLKSALDSYSRRIITWNSAAAFGDDLPCSFEFLGGVIFISNKSLDKLPQPLISRSLVADVSMTREETLDRLRVIAAQEKFMPNFSAEAKTQAIEFIANHINNPMVPAVNIRTLMMVVKLVGVDNWERAALYLLINSR